MNKFFKTLIWIAILAVAGFLIYSILPEYPQSVIKGTFQPVVDTQAQVRIDQIKVLTNKDLKSTYGTILESHTKMPAWVYKQEGATETVTFYGGGASLNLKDIPDHEDRLYTSCVVKVEFIINGNDVKINTYVEGNLEDDVVKDIVFQQLLAGND